ncbi:MAG: STAS/SEC14 domain-containing protein [Robiginitomaculum sp.]|nr:STAS/SEC14 domain-containing protein [Robiginitomaculum sp.]
MIKIEKFKAKNIIRVSPLGKFEKSDFKRLNTCMDEYINSHDRVPSVVIHAEKFPRWKKFSAFLAHIKFVKNAQNFVPKVAIVSDKISVKIIPALVRHFIKAKVRLFSVAGMEEAMDWAAAPGDHPGRFRILEGFPNDVIAVEAEGIITAQDYEDTLRPLVEAKKKRHDQLKMLFVADEGFQSYTSGAMWEDTKFGLMHLSDLKKLALVSDLGWMRTAIRLFGPLMPAKVRVFHTHEYEDAAKWIKR